MSTENNFWENRNKQREAFQAEYDAIEKRKEDTNFYSSSDYAKLAKRQSFLQEVLDLFALEKSLHNQINLIGKMIFDQTESPEFLELAEEEYANLEGDYGATQRQINELLMPKDPNDERDCIVEIRAAAGGDESSLFAGELYRMYSRWCEKNGFKIELISESPSEAGGFKEIAFEVHGVDAYKNLKFEAGVHRVQRIPVTESSGRIHTSTTTVAVLPEAEETDIEINPSDLRIDVFRAGGHGGQSVNTTDSAVRITHIPTGIVVSQQDEKSQIKNKAKAMTVLRSRLLQNKIEEEQKALSADRLKLIGSGDRSEKIRTYNFPQDRITDHRIGYSRSNIPAALDGEINDLIVEMQTAESQAIKDEN